MEATAAAPLLRHDQVVEMQDEIRVLEHKLVTKEIEDKGAVHEQLRRVKRQLDTQQPKPFSSDEVDRAVRREAELRDEISKGMLSHEEMRKNPPGAVDRHRAWEKRAKPLINEWKNIQRRLHAGDDAEEAASVERFRPTTSTMNMDNAQIPGKQFFLPPYGAALPVTFSVEQLAIIRAASPALADQLCTLTNAQRSDVKEALVDKGIGLSAEPSQASKDGKRGVEKREATKRTLSAEHKAKMKAGREAKAKKAAE